MRLIVVVMAALALVRPQHPLPRGGMPPPETEVRCQSGVY